MILDCQTLEAFLAEDVEARQGFRVSVCVEANTTFKTSFDLLQGFVSSFWRSSHCRSKILVHSTSSPHPC